MGRRSEVDRGCDRLARERQRRSARGVVGRPPYLPLLYLAPRPHCYTLYSFSKFFRTVFNVNVFFAFPKTAVFPVFLDLNRCFSQLQLGNNYRNGKNKTQILLENFGMKIGEPGLEPRARENPNLHALRDHGEHRRRHIAKTARTRAEIFIHAKRPEYNKRRGERGAPAPARYIATNYKVSCYACDI